MRCFEFTDYKLVPGFPVELIDKTLCVPLAYKQGRSIENARLLIAPELSDSWAQSRFDGHFLNQSTRLLFCDFEQRGDIWLSPKTDATKDEVLLLLSFWNTFRTDDEELSIGVGKANAHARVLLVKRPSEPKKTSGLHSGTGCVALVRMQRGASFCVEYRKDVRLGALRRTFSGRTHNTQELTITFALDNEGKILIRGSDSGPPC